MVGMRLGMLLDPLSEAASRVHLLSRSQPRTVGGLSRWCASIIVSEGLRVGLRLFGDPVVVPRRSLPWLTAGVGLGWTERICLRVVITRHRSTCVRAMGGNSRFERDGTRRLWCARWNKSLAERFYVPSEARALLHAPALQSEIKFIRINGD